LTKDLGILVQALPFLLGHRRFQDVVEAFPPDDGNDGLTP
jgi:hypothetical protein